MKPHDPADGLAGRTAPGTAAGQSTGDDDARRKDDEEVELELNVLKEAFFPTLFYFCDIPDAAALNEKLLPAILEERERDPEGVVRSNVKRVGSWHSQASLQRKPHFRDLVMRLDAIVSHMFVDLNYHPESIPFCDHLWAITNPRFGYNRYHNHPEALWSGVYYVQTPKECGHIRFRDPREHANFKEIGIDEDKGRPRELWQEVHYEPKPGRVIFFPGWLGHEVDPNLSEEEGVAGERVIVSFNYSQRSTTQNGVTNTNDAWGSY